MQYAGSAWPIIEPDFYDCASSIEGTVLLPSGLPLLRWQSKLTEGPARAMLLYGEFGDPTAPVGLSNGLDPDETGEDAIASLLIWVRESVVQSQADAVDAFERTVESHFAFHAQIVEGLRRADSPALLVNGQLVEADCYRSDATGMDVWSLQSPAQVLVAVDQGKSPPPLTTWAP